MKKNKKNRWKLPIIIGSVLMSIIVGLTIGIILITSNANNSDVETQTKTVFNNLTTALVVGEAKTVSFNQILVAPNCFCDNHVSNYHLATWCGHRNGVWCQGQSTTKSVNLSAGSYRIKATLSDLNSEQKYESVELMIGNQVFVIPDLGSGTKTYTIPALQTLSGSVNIKAAHRYRNNFTGLNYHDEPTKIGSGNAVESVKIQTVVFEKMINEAPPINGQCSSEKNICTRGTLVDIDDTNTEYKWNCNGVNNGQTAHCNLIKVLLRCGDGVVNQEAGEECDDGNTANGDGCSSTCRFESLGINLTKTVSNALVTTGTSVTYTYLVKNNSTMELVNVALTDDKLGDISCPKTALLVSESMTCTKDAVINNDVTNVATVHAKGAMSGEGVTDTDSTSVKIKSIETVCGDGHVDSGEECDDGNTADGDGCDSNCQIENFGCATTTSQSSDVYKLTAFIKEPSTELTIEEGETVSFKGSTNKNNTVNKYHWVESDSQSSANSCNGSLLSSTGNGALEYKPVGLGRHYYCLSVEDIKGDTATRFGCNDTITVIVEEEKKEKKKEEKKKEEKKEECDASIGNYIWYDTNGNRVQEDIEEGIEGVKVCAYNGNDKECDTTNKSGKYKIKDLCEHTYDVVVKNTKGMVQTYDPDGKKDNKTTVKLKNGDKHTKADFGYRGAAPSTGLTTNIALLIGISTLITIGILMVMKKKGAL